MKNWRRRFELKYLSLQFSDSFQLIGVIVGWQSKMVDPSSISKVELALLRHTKPLARGTVPISGDVARIFSPKIREKWDRFAVYLSHFSRCKRAKVCSRAL